jgi:predicted ABC-type ATPase
MEENQPRLLVILGPNGSGKSSLLSEILASYTFAGFEFFNPDLVGEEYFADIPNDLDRSMRAVLWCGRQQKRCGSIGHCSAQF